MSDHINRNEIQITSPSWIELLESEKKSIKKSILSRGVVWIRDNSFIIVGLLALVTVILGTIGFTEVSRSSSPSHTFSVSDIYRTLQLFVGTATLPANPPITLVIASAMAPMVTAYAGIRSGLIIFTEQMSLFKARFYRGHTIVCGLCEPGYHLARDIIMTGDKVVVIEINPQNKYIKELEKTGIPVVKGSPNSRSILKKANIAKADNLITICGDDALNIDTVLNANEVLSEKQKHSMNYFVHIENPNLVPILSKGGLEGQETTDISFFNLDINAARTLFFEFPIDRYVDTISESADQPHIVILGMNAMTHHIIVQTARLCHFRNGKRVRISVIHQEENRLADQLKLYYPRIGDIVDLTFHIKPYEDLDIRDTSLKIGDTEVEFHYMIVTTGNDQYNMSLSLVYRDTINYSIPVFVHLREAYGYVNILESSDISDISNLHTFGTYEKTCTKELILVEQLDAIAKSVHSYYANKSNDRTEWDDLPAGLKNSNRLQADHILVKLRSFGLKLRFDDEKQMSDFTFTDEEVEELAMMEHDRWVAARTLSGWQYGEETVREQKINKNLRPYSELPEEIKEYNRESIRNIPELLNELNLGIERSL